MKHLDLGIAATVLFGGLALTTFSYQQMLVMEKPQVTLFQDHLVLGKRHYKITSQDSCIGELQIETESQQNVVLNLDGTVRTSFKEAPADIILKARGIFNPLGQLADLYMSLGFGEIEVTLQTTGVHPIQTHIVSKGLNKEFDYTLSVDGPVLIHEFEPGSFRLEYAKADLLSSPFIQGTGNLLDRSIGLKVTALVGPADQCSAEQTSRFKLDQLAADLFKVMQGQGNILNMLTPGTTR